MVVTTYKAKVKVHKLYFLAHSVGMLHFMQFGHKATTTTATHDSIEEKASDGKELGKSD